jgi:hypothetical protein
MRDALFLPFSFLSRSLSFLLRSLHRDEAHAQILVSIHDEYHGDGSSDRHGAKESLVFCFVSLEEEEEEDLEGTKSTSY